VSELQQVPVDKLHPHPQNPRLVQREDVIASIETQLKEKGSFDPAHALLVRPVDDGYQIVMGHHRHTAAKRAGLTTVPCWVRTISDSEAFMLLATSNEQSDMTPLEWGMHALNYQGKLKEYAAIVGKAESSLSESRKAAEVLQYFTEKIRTCEFPQNSKIRTCEFLDKTRHLYEISKADKSVWILLCDWLLSGEHGQREVIDIVDEVKQLKSDHAFLQPYEKVVSRYLENRSIDGKSVKMLGDLVDSTVKAIYQRRDEHPESTVDFDGYVEAFYYWLKDNNGGDSWNVAKVRAYRSELIRKLDTELSLVGRVALYVAVAESLPLGDESINVVITSPPYNLGAKNWDMGGGGREKRDGIGYDSTEDSMDYDQYIEWQIAVFKELYRVARPGASFFYNHKARTLDGHCIDPVSWVIRSDNPWTYRQRLTWDRTSTHNHEPRLFDQVDETIIWMTKGKPALSERGIVGVKSVWSEFGPIPNTWHPAPFTIELPRMLLRAIGADVLSGQDKNFTVLDPFAGSCTTIEAALEFGCKGIGIDKSESYLRKAIDARLGSGWSFELLHGENTEDAE
jgi:ParB/RepB/Spo0J family partition protein